MAAGPIPWSAVNNWAIRHDITGEDFQILLHHVRAMENALAQLEQSKLERKNNYNRG